MDNAIAKFIRLKSGDDLVAEAFETGDDSGDYITVINPLKAIYVPSTVTGYLQIAFMPWVFSRICDKQEFMIKVDDVLLMTDVSEYMEKYYWDTMEGPQEEPEEKHQDHEGLERLEEILEQLGIDGKRTLH